MPTPEIPEMVENFSGDGNIIYVYLFWISLASFNNGDRLNH